MLPPRRTRPGPLLPVRRGVISKGLLQAMFRTALHCLPALLFTLAAAALAGCGGPDAAPSAEAGLQEEQVRLPDGAVITCEVTVTPQQHARGLMFREHLPPDRGMLFVFPDFQERPFWMYQTLIPLDIIWMDAGRTIVHIEENIPPCPPEKGRNCPSYGEGVYAKYVLELAAGQAAKHGLAIGGRLEF